MYKVQYVTNKGNVCSFVCRFTEQNKILKSQKAFFVIILLQNVEYQFKRTNKKGIEIKQQFPLSILRFTSNVTAGTDQRNDRK